MWKCTAAPMCKLCVHSRKLEHYLIILTLESVCQCSPQRKTSTVVSYFHIIMSSANHFHRCNVTSNLPSRTQQPEADILTNAWTHSSNSTATFFFFLAALGLHCCSWVFSHRRVGATLLLRSLGSRACRFQWLWHVGFTSPAPCGIFPDQASNSCRLHWRVDS